jgi:hypothetical protein
VASSSVVSRPPDARSIARAARAGTAPAGPSARTPSMPGSRASAPLILCWASSGSARSTASTSALPPASRRPSSSPAQRPSRAMFPTSWFTHNARVTPASAIRRPAARPASRSGWPMCALRPRSRKTRAPELIERMGMPAAAAARIDGARASPSGIEIARPCGREATTASMSWLISTMLKLPGAWYSTRSPSSTPASRAPVATTDQKGSADCPWVTRTMRGVSACAVGSPRSAAPISSPRSPGEPQAARASSQSDAGGRSLMTGGGPWAG